MFGGFRLVPEHGVAVRSILFRYRRNMRLARGPRKRGQFSRLAWSMFPLTPVVFFQAQLYADAGLQVSNLC